MKLAVFDFDGTLFPQDTLPFLLKQWREQKLSMRRLMVTYAMVGVMYIRYKLGLYGSMSREHMRKKAMQRFTHIFHAMTKEDVDTFFERCARIIVQSLNTAVVAEMRNKKAGGFHTVLLSGGYQRLMDYVGASLSFDTVIGTALKYKQDTVDASQTLDIVSGDEKAQRLNDAFSSVQVDWEQSCAYADSLSDMPILRLVGHPVVVNPDPGLAKELETTGWPVLSEA